MTEVKPARSASMAASVPRSLLTGSESSTEAGAVGQARLICGGGRGLDLTPFYRALHHADDQPEPGACRRADPRRLSRIDAADEAPGHSFGGPPKGTDGHTGDGIAHHVHPRPLVHSVASRLRALALSRGVSRPLVPGRCARAASEEKRAHQRTGHCPTPIDLHHGPILSTTCDR